MTTELHFIGKDGQTRRIGTCGQVKLELADPPGEYIPGQGGQWSQPITIDCTVEPSETFAAWMASLPPGLPDIEVSFDPPQGPTATAFAELQKAGADLGNVIAAAFGLPPELLAGRTIRVRR